MKTMRNTLLATTLCATAAIGGQATANVVNGKSINETVRISQQEMKGDALSAAIVNEGSTSIDSVDLVVRYDWVWNDDAIESAAGDGPGWVEYVTISDDIHPGYMLNFTYKPREPLATRDDGYFVPRVAVVGVAAYE